MPDEAVSRTERGFADYAEVEDSYGQKVTVRQSSAAGEDAVWVFCEKIEGTSGTPHLSVENAREIRDGLNRFIREVDPQTDPVAYNDKDEPVAIPLRPDA